MITKNNKKKIIPFYDIKRREDNTNNDKKIFDILNKFVHPSVRKFAEKRYIHETKKRLSYIFTNQKNNE